MRKPLVFTYVDDKAKLRAMCAELRDEDLLGIDLECENNMHHYGVYVTLIQISTRKKQWLVDMLALDGLGPLKNILHKKSIRKIFHDVSFDLRILKHQYDCRPKNVFDTQVAAQLLGKKEIGLKPLLAEYFGVKKQSKFQTADWTKRPLTPAMIKYAVRDSKYLIMLYDRLQKELKQKGRSEWIEEESKEIEHNGHEHKDFTYSDMKGYSLLSPKQRSILQALFSIREQYAKKTDMPAHFIINNKKFIELVKTPPQNVDTWQRLRNVHPIIKQNAKKIHEKIQEAKTKRIELDKRKIAKRYNEKQKNQLRELQALREQLAKELGIEAHLILNKEQMQRITLDENYDSLFDWQKKLVKEKINSKKE